MIFDLAYWWAYLTSDNATKWTVTWIVGVACIWCYQFIRLMLLKDEDFPGRFDKSLWVAAFLFAAPFAPFVFLCWRGASKELARRESMEVFDE